MYLNGLPLRLKKPLKNILFLPLTLPHLVSGIALLLLFGNLGIGEFLDKYLDISFIYTQKGIVLAQCFVNLPLTIKVILMSLDEINDKMVFVARTLGCNEYQSFKFVVLPSLKNGILSSAVMTWSKALGEFGAVIMVAGTTRMKTEILPTAIFLNMSTGDLDIAIGISVILIFLSIISLVTFEILTNKNKVHKTKYVKN
ncbi:MAG: ABC transporter permease [Oscillospiraceae bacterium]